MCAARDRQVDGKVWECPVLARIPYMQLQHTPTAPAAPHSTSNTPTAGTPHQQRCSHMFSVSVGRFPAIYWLGQYSNGQFDLESAVGPTPLDLGDLLYAPNLLSVNQVCVGGGGEGGGRQQVCTATADQCNLFHSDWQLRSCCLLRRLVCCATMCIMGCWLTASQHTGVGHTAVLLYQSAVPVVCGSLVQSTSDRLLLWGWLPELPSPHCSTAGCISLPRQLLLSPDGHLVQQPLPELASLHTGPAWSAKQLQLQPQLPRWANGRASTAYGICIM